MWAYNVQLYFEAAGQSSAEIAGWLSWIPLAAGSLGAVLGGVLSDVLYVRRGLAGRVLVLVVSQLATAPCAAAALYLRPPHAYYLLIPVYILGEGGARVSVLLLCCKGMWWMREKTTNTTLLEQKLTT